MSGAAISSKFGLTLNLHVFPRTRRGGQFISKHRNESPTISIPWSVFVCSQNKIINYLFRYF